MNENQKNRWANVRAKGLRRYIWLNGAGLSALFAVIGHLTWWLIMLIWKGESTPHFIREPGSAIAMIIGFALAGYIYNSREWIRNEREYLALMDSEGHQKSVV